MKAGIKRLISLILAMAMSLSLFSANVWAAKPQDSIITETKQVESILKENSGNRVNSNPVNETVILAQVSNELKKLLKPIVCLI